TRRPATLALPAHRQARRRPRAPAAVHRLDPRVAHPLQVVGGERGAEAAAAVEDEVARLFRHRPLDVPLDDALAEVARAGQVAAAPFLLLADVDQRDGVFRLPHPLDVVNRDLADTPPGVVDEAEEPRRVLHHSSAGPFVPMKRSSGSANSRLNVVRLPYARVM